MYVNADNTNQSIPHYTIPIHIYYTPCTPYTPYNSPACLLPLPVTLLSSSDSSRTASCSSDSASGGTSWSSRECSAAGRRRDEAVPEVVAVVADVVVVRAVRSCGSMCIER